MRFRSIHKQICCIILLCLFVRIFRPDKDIKFSVDNHKTSFQDYDTPHGLKLNKEMHHDEIFVKEQPTQHDKRAVYSDSSFENSNTSFVIEEHEKEELVRNRADDIAKVKDSQDSEIDNRINGPLAQNNSADEKDSVTFGQVDFALLPKHNEDSEKQKELVNKHNKETGRKKVVASDQEQDYKIDPPDKKNAGQDEQADKKLKFIKDNSNKNNKETGRKKIVDNSKET